MNAPFKLYTDEELAPYLARERRKEDAKRAHHQREVERSRGLSDYIERPDYRSEPQIMVDAMAALDRDRAFKASPRGRYLAALAGLDQLGYAAEAERARQAYRRGFEDDRYPVNPREIGCALTILNPIAGQDARDARDALAELLMNTKREAA